MRKELLKGLTDEQIAKVEACKSSEEILALAKEEGVALSDEQLEAVSGGGCGEGNKCPKCGSKDITTTNYSSKDNPSIGAGDKVWTEHKCNKCGNVWM